MFMSRAIPWVVGEGVTITNLVFSLQILLAFSLLHFVLQGSTCLIYWLSLDFLLCILIPYDEKDKFF